MKKSKKISVGRSQLTTYDPSPDLSKGDPNNQSVALNDINLQVVN